MTYTWLIVIFLGVASAAAALLYRRRWPRRHRAASLVIAAVALFVLTIVFDSAMIAADLFTYGDGRILGLRIGAVPIEDLSYPLAAVVLLPALWAAWGGDSDR